MAPWATRSSSPPVARSSEVPRPIAGLSWIRFRPSPITARAPSASPWTRFTFTRSLTPPPPIRVLGSPLSSVAPAIRSTSARNAAISSASSGRLTPSTAASIGSWKSESGPPGWRRPAMLKPVNSSSGSGTLNS